MKKRGKLLCEHLSGVASFVPVVTGGFLEQVPQVET